CPINKVCARNGWPDRPSGESDLTWINALRRCRTHFTHATQIKEEGDNVQTHINRRGIPYPVSHVNRSLRHRSSDVGPIPSRRNGCERLALGQGLKYSDGDRLWVSCDRQGYVESDDGYRRQHRYRQSWRGN